jgi:hypothetical protein
VPEDQSSPEIDRELLRTYLDDHLTGATGVLQRLDRMVDTYRDLPVHGDLVRLRADIRTERRRLTKVIATLGLRRSLPKEALARVGEVAGRLKRNGRWVSRSPLTPLLELELLQSGVSGKSGLWRVLGTHALALGLDPAEFRALEEQADDQLDVIVRCHRVLVPHALRSNESG